MLVTWNWQRVGEVGWCSYMYSQVDPTYPVISAWVSALRFQNSIEDKSWCIKISTESFFAVVTDWKLTYFILKLYLVWEQSQPFAVWNMWTTRRHLHLVTTQRHCSNNRNSICFCNLLQFFEVPYTYSQESLILVF